MNVLITTYPFDENNEYLSLIKKYGGKIYFNPYKRKMKPHELKKELETINPEIIIAGTEKYDSNILDICDNLKVISRVGIGMDSIDIKECKKRGIKVYNTPDAPSNAVSELTICQIISALRRTHDFNKGIRLGEWNRHIGKEIKNCTIGIIGCGRIGRLTIKKLKAFSPKKIYINDINKNKENIDNCTPASKEKILKESDIISIHIPLDFENKDYICKEELSKLKKDCVLINTSRGGIVNENDLYKWLEENINATAALDVFENEPYCGKLIKLKNVLLSPHAGSCTKNSRLEMEKKSIENILIFFKND